MVASLIALGYASIIADSPKGKNNCGKKSVILKVNVFRSTTQNAGVIGLGNGRGGSGREQGTSVAETCPFGWKLLVKTARLVL